MEALNGYKYEVQGMPFNQIDLPERIYKYRDWKNPCHKRLLTDSEIYFAKPLNFKDNHELDFDILLDTASPQTKENTQKAIDEKLNIFCVSKHSNNYTLWKTFANAQTGFCVGINSRKMFSDDEMVGGGGQVLYYKQDHKPTFTPPYNNDDIRMFGDFIRVIMSLPEQYKKEDEYRVFKNSIENPQAIISIESIEEVILGRHISEDDEKEIIEICKSRLQMKRLCKAHYDYDLEYYSFTDII